MRFQLSIVMPVLDEAATLAATLCALVPLRAHGHELIVVDGGSQDLTAALCQGMAERVLGAPRGRARRMNAGAAASRHEVLLFVRRPLFGQVGGFPDQPLMEDVGLSRRLRALASPACLRERVTTSGRRWQRHGVWRTIFLVWRLRWRYWRGASPEALARAWR